MPTPPITPPTASRLRPGTRYVILSGLAVPVEALRCDYRGGATVRTKKTATLPERVFEVWEA